VNGPIIPRDEAARELSVEPRVLLRYERRGLVRVVSEGAVEGYGPEEVRRLWTIVSYQRDLGVNLAGVEVALKLRDHMAEVHRRVGSLAERLRDALDDPGADQVDA
jgi:MerR family transcriptional regulator, heat shock protein HspR